MGELLLGAARRGRSNQPKEGDRGPAGAGGEIYDEATHVANRNRALAKAA